MEEEWTQISFSFFWPYEAMLIGYEMVEPNETQHWYSFMLHCFFAHLDTNGASEIGLIHNFLYICKEFII